MVEKMVVLRILSLAGDKNIMQQVSAVALLKASELEKYFSQMAGFEQNPLQAAHYTYVLQQINEFKKGPSNFKLPEAPKLPDGSPIGCNGIH